MIFKANFFNKFLKSCEIAEQAKNKEIVFEDKQSRFSFTTQGYICIGESGFIGHKGELVPMSEARIFSSSNAAMRRFPRSNVFPVELKITGPMLENKQGIIIEKAKDLSIAFNHSKLEQAMALRIIVWK